LAESWAWEDDGQTLRVTLREGIRFHDGTPLTATTAAAALDEARRSAQRLDRYWSLEEIRNIRAEGERDVVLELVERSTFALDGLEVPLGRQDDRVGTGPFQVQEGQGPGVTLIRNEQYHRGAPAIHRVVIQPFETLRVVWAALLRREIDMVVNVAPDAVEFVSNDQIGVQTYSRRYQYMVAFNSARAPFNNPAVRRALNMAVDRQKIVQDVFKGHGTQAIGPLWPQHYAYDSSVTQVFDRDQARRILEQVGIRGSTRRNPLSPPDAILRFRCLIPEGRSVEHLALEIQKQLYDVGVDMQFDVVPPVDFGRRLGAGDFDAALLDIVSGPTVSRPYLFWRSARTFKGNYNLFGYENPEAERLFQQLRTSFNEVATQTAMRRLQRVLLDDSPALFLVWTDRAQAVRRSFKPVSEEGRDPLMTLWQWQPGTDPAPELRTQLE
jgi:peptide/nickel transport system substrate-binding protein